MRIPLALVLAPLALGACSSDPEPVADTGTNPVDTGMIGMVDTGVMGMPDTGTPDSGGPCVYPTAVRPMALDQPIPAYSWPEALDGARNMTDLSLTDAYCNSDTDIDWGTEELILFVSIPAF